MKEKSNRLPMSTKLGYGVGSISIPIGYDFASGFMLFFFTTIAGIQPAFAGTIIFISVLWDAISDPIMGMISDNSRSKYGKRRPFLLASAVPYGLSVALLFLAVPLEGIWKNGYYLMMALIFWTSYTVMYIPYNTLGATLSLDPEERTRLSSIRQMFNFVGTAMATAVPTFLVGTFIGMGIGKPTAWFSVACILGLMATCAILLSWRATRGKEQIEGLDLPKVPLKNVMKEVKEIFRLRAYIIIIFGLLFYYVGHTINIGNALFFGSAILKISEDTLSIIYVVVIVTSIIVTPIVGKLAVRFDKRNVFIVLLSFSGLVCITAKFMGLTTLLQFSIVIALWSIGQAAFWVLGYVLLFDIIEIDEFVNGKRRDATIIAYQSFVKKVGAAFAGQMAGLALQWGGYNAALENQSATALGTIESLSTLVPGITMLLSVLMVWLYPVTRKKYKLLTTALEQKKNGQPYSTEGFEDLLKQYGGK